MNRTVRTLTGMAALGVLGYLGGSLWAQYPPNQPVQQTAAAAPAPEPLRTRVAVINMVKVLKDYKKFQSQADYIKNQLQTRDKSYMEPKRNQLLKMRNEMQVPTATAEQREKIERDMRKLQMELQEMDQDFRKEAAKLQGDVYVTIYREIEHAVNYFARANAIEMVLQYDEAIDQADYYNAANIGRKLQNGALMPIYMAPGMDITDHIIKMLNDRYTSSNPAAMAPAAGQRPGG